MSVTLSLNKMSAYIALSHKYIHVAVVPLKHVRYTSRPFYKRHNSADTPRLRCELYVLNGSYRKNKHHQCMFQSTVTESSDSIHLKFVSFRIHHLNQNDPYQAAAVLRGQHLNLIH